MKGALARMEKVQKTQQLRVRNPAGSLQRKTISARIFFFSVEPFLPLKYKFLRIMNSLAPK